ncbi:Crp/Fnr family transcriptional regulator [Novosphingobium sp. Fuku2-ISO-50]|uniref:Crp/Fnr family transcriptional regulator n=1 Tax=Novosphingobium sp. Fuku2-ISO-50 TaxID=1739114 RepID=UPI00076DAC59|nr:helix-turn-helix domain-containing protein [Novosphingobium sp. Fuku2-ISO-50]KUR81215.1 Crp/Fnr family transcriptional regulator [Novosphingobium sp. Fuku2-ISO-50]
MATCSQCPVRESSICHSLSADALDRFGRAGRRQTLLAGQTLMWEGEDALLVGNVVDGILKLTASLSDGRDQMLGIAFPSDFIGRAFGTKTRHSVTAVTDAEVCTFRRSDFDDLARRHADVEHDLLKRTLGELDQMRKWMQVLGKMTATERVAVFLIEMAARLCPDVESETALIRFTLPIGRQDMGDLLGLTIETVSRQITNLRQRQIIGTPDRRSIVIYDRRALAACAGMG